MERKRCQYTQHVRIGHVDLKVADLQRAIAFYRDVLGFELTQRYGRQARFSFSRRVPPSYRAEHGKAGAAYPKR